MIPIAPRDIADERIKLAYEYGVLGERLVEIKKIKAVKWLELRVENKSDTQTDMSWDRTELGIEEMEIRAKMKSKEFKMSALKTQLDVMNNEVRNQW